MERPADEQTPDLHDAESHTTFVEEEGHEEGDLSARSIAVSALLIGLVLAAVLLVVWVVLGVLSGEPLALPAAPVRPATPTPRPSGPNLEVVPAAELASLQATQRAQLHSYGWVDQEAGVAHIPVERAMDLLLERGFPLPSATVTATVTPATTATTPAGEGAVAAGRQLFRQLECNVCHLADGSGQGPSLAGVFGSQVELESGETVTADEEYVRRSILEPMAQIVAGYEPLMPTDFADRLSERELQQLIAYVRSLQQ
ncbi:MAG: cytochrome c [Candidatus Promineifilaceae bacterium]|nr:cytochrome c [Candidatus Promineifilaceae bacterium]